VSKGVHQGKSIHTNQRESFPDRTYASIKFSRRISQNQAHYKAGGLSGSPQDQRILTLPERSCIK